MKAPRPAEEDAGAILRRLFETDPILAALQRGDLLWGDLFVEAPVLPPTRARPVAASGPSAEAISAEQEFDHADSEEALLWTQPFATNLEMHGPDRYDMSEMSDADYNAFMIYIGSRGWQVDPEISDRKGCRAWPVLNGTPKVVNRLQILSKPGTDTGRRKSCPVPRFCKDGKKCQTRGCPYVHGDTIPRVNKPCGFGCDCGASDPSGKKRSQCLYMHPGETWTADLVIRRLPIA